MSLWRMSTVQGATVPNGFVLTTTFFERWFETLQQDPCWQTMLDSCVGYSPDDQSTIKRLHDACEATKEASRRLTFDDSQRESVGMALEKMRSSLQGPMRFVAVRSSSPEEDLAGMSFAGGYETVLGVNAEVAAVQVATQTVFASCLDERVFVYKISHNIVDLTPRIAVVVQRQVAASVAGVAFSIDPISNCCDWATVNSNFGLGESVVSGQCSPDYYLVNKHSKAMVKKELGKKETSVWLGEDGGVHERRVEGGASQWTLTDDEVHTVTAQLTALEEFYGHPLDTEFALDEQRRLMWLQARPVTTHVSLPAQLMTPPGTPEVLWLDVMQIVQGFTNLASATGLSFLQLFLFRSMVPVALGLKPENATIHNRPFTVVPEEGQLYLNGSFILKLVGFQKRESWAEKIELMDFNAAKIIRELEYDFSTSASFIPLPLLLAWNNPGMLFNVYKSSSNIEGTARRAADVHAGVWGLVRDLYQMRGFGDKCSLRGAYQDTDRSSNTTSCCAGPAFFPPTAELLTSERKRRGRPDGAEEHVLDLLEAVMPTICKSVLNGLVATTISGGLGKSNINKMFAKAPEDVKALTDDLTQGCGFVTTVLSDLLEEMAEALEETGRSWTLEELKAASCGVDGQSLPPKAGALWQTVIEQFGHRGVGELDMSTPRYWEDPGLLLEQVVSMFSLEKSMRPKGMAAKAVQKREDSVSRLSAWLVESRLNVADFQLQLQRYHSHFCYRESGKYLVIKLVELSRLEVLEQGKRLLTAGQIDVMEDVWLLTLEDLRRIHCDKTVDVRKLVGERKAARAKNAHAKNWPKVVTSRGRCLRPQPREAKEGEVAGHAVSPGVVQGRIKVLHDPREKPLLTGEILVAKATDPGWTPLFVPAAGILLEVGGALQHGALVAREFGKPCVAGIEDVTEKFKDGMLVEVDGSEGIVKILEQ